MADSPFKQLLGIAGDLIPGFREEAVLASSDFILATPASQPRLQALYDFWSQQHPEAGSAYWRIRSWNLLCWQPLWLAVIAVYAVGAVPRHLEQLAQRYHPQSGMVCGVYLADQDCLTAAPAQLIPTLGKSLRNLFRRLLEQFSLISQISHQQAYLQIAEQLLDIFVRLQHYRPALSAAQITGQAALWLEHLHLPAGYRKALVPSTDSSTVQLKRRSCCMHYRRADGELCSGCPRAQRQIPSQTP